MRDTVPSPGVKLTLNQAKQAYKDLIMYDAQKSIDSIRIGQIQEYKAVIDLQRKELATVEERERNWKLALDGQTLLMNDWKSRYEQSEKLRKRSVRWGRFKVVLIGGAVGYIIYQSIK